MSRSGAWLLAGALALTACTTTVPGTGTPAATSTADPNSTVLCPGAVEPTRNLPAAAYTLFLANSTKRVLALDDDRSGPRTLAQLVADLQEGDRAALSRELRAAGFVDAYQRTWSSGATGTPERKLEVLTVYRFATPAGACRFQADTVRRAHLVPVPIVGVQGAVGTTTTSGALRGALTEVTKGPYLIEAEALAYDTDVAGWPTDVLQQAYPAI